MSMLFFFPFFLKVSEEEGEEAQVVVAVEVDMVVVVDLVDHLKVMTRVSRPEYRLSKRT